MAYTPCATSQILANGQKNCEAPIFEGLKTVAVGFAKSDIVSVTRGTGAAKNQVTAISLREGAKTFVVEAGGETAYADTALEFDAATNRWNKTIAFTAPNYGAKFDASFVEPLLKNKDGFVFILQRKNEYGGEGGDCAFPIIGLERGAVGSADTLNFGDTASAGAHVISLVETGAPSAEIELFTTDYETSKAAFDALVAKAV